MNNLNGTGQSVSQLSVRHVPSPCSRRARDDNGGKRDAPFVWHYPLTQCQIKCSRTVLCASQAAARVSEVTL